MSGWGDVGLILRNSRKLNRAWCDVLAYGKLRKGEYSSIWGWVERETSLVSAMILKDRY